MPRSTWAADEGLPDRSVFPIRCCEPLEFRVWSLLRRIASSLKVRVLLCILLLLCCRQKLCKWGFIFMSRTVDEAGRTHSMQH